MSVVALCGGDAHRYLKTILVKFYRMDKRLVWISVLGVVISFVGGFLLANAFNRSEMDALRAENARLKDSQTKTASQPDLTPEEIRQRIAQADQNPGNFSFQKNLGIALYRYAAMKKDAELLADTSRILVRANELNPKDYEILVALGNLFFDIGYIRKDDEKFGQSREFYEKALSQRPGDVEVRTDYGLTFFLENPPNNEQAIAEFQKSLAENPKHERSLQFLIQAYLKTGKKSEAENYLAQLKQINPNAPSLSEIETQVSQTNKILQQ
jgi:tetratricopeptide (TPR) repeat protein